MMRLFSATLGGGEHSGRQHSFLVEASTTVTLAASGKAPAPAATLAAGTRASMFQRQPQRSAAPPPLGGTPGDGFTQAQNGLRNGPIVLSETHCNNGAFAHDHMRSSMVTLAMDMLGMHW